MLFSLSATLFFCLLSAAVGFLAFLARSLRTRAATRIVEFENGPKEAGPNVVERLPVELQPIGDQEFHSVVNALTELTALVDKRVGQHSLKIDEVTRTLENPSEYETNSLLFAGKTLISANRNLQSELCFARDEIQRQRNLMRCCVLESRMDALTSVPNRRALDEKLIASIAELKRYGTGFSVLILDIDHFKRVNDRFGHIVGDQLLKSFSRSLTSTFRETDFIARFGGEEFVAILPRTNIDGACVIAERVRNVIAAARYKIGDFDLRVTASIGIKEFGDDDDECEVLEKADKALYAAKNGGRNCCYYYDGNSSCSYLTEQTTVAFDTLTNSFGDSSDFAATATIVDFEMEPEVVLS